jgi:hypothetical protein
MGADPFHLVLAAAAETDDVILSREAMRLGLSRRTLETFRAAPANRWSAELSPYRLCAILCVRPFAVRNSPCRQASSATPAQPMSMDCKASGSGLRISQWT